MGSGSLRPKVQGAANPSPPDSHAAQCASWACESPRAAQRFKMILALVALDADTVLALNAVRESSSAFIRNILMRI